MESKDTQRIIALLQEILDSTDSSSSSGVLPEYTQAEIDALTPSGAMIIFNTTTDLINYYDGSSWTAIPLSTAEIIKHVSVDQSTTSSTAQNITDLVFAVTATTKYRVQGFYHIGCDNTGGVKFAITLPSGATMFVSYFGITTSSIASLHNFNETSGTLTSAFLTLTSQNGQVRVDGIIEIGETAGEVQFQFASTTGGQTSTIHTESYISLTPIS